MFTTLEPSPVAVIGAGRWGRLHAAKLAATPGARLAAVVDVDLGRAQALAARHPGARACASVAELPPAVRAATVAVDLPRLAGAVAAALDARLDVLAEKPLALDVPTAEGLVTRARAAGRRLWVGYLERFLPLPTGGQRLVARRSGPPGRADTPLGLDWLVHDVDHALRLLGPLLPVSMTVAPDTVTLQLAGDGGRVARLTANRGARRVRRRLWLDGRRHDLIGGDPLGAELAAFVAAVRGAPDGRLATGSEAVEVLRVLDAARALRSAA